MRLADGRGALGRGGRTDRGARGAGAGGGGGGGARAAARRAGRAGAWSSRAAGAGRAGPARAWRGRGRCWGAPCRMRAAGERARRGLPPTRPFARRFLAARGRAAAGQWRSGPRASLLFTCRMLKGFSACRYGFSRRGVLHTLSEPRPPRSRCGDLCCRRSSVPPECRLSRRRTSSEPRLDGVSRLRGAVSTRCAAEAVLGVSDPLARPTRSETVRFRKIDLLGREKRFVGPRTTNGTTCGLSRVSAGDMASDFACLSQSLT